MFKQLPFEAKQSPPPTSAVTPLEYVFNTNNHEKLQSIGTYFKASFDYNSYYENEQKHHHISSENVDLTLCEIIDAVCCENSKHPKPDHHSHSFDLPSLVMSMDFIGLTEVGASLLSDKIPEAPYIYQLLNSSDLPSLVISMDFIGLTEIDATLLSDRIPEAPYIYQLLYIEKLEANFILENNLLFEGIFDIYFKDMGMTVPQFLEMFKRATIYSDKLKRDWDSREKSIPEAIHSLTQIEFFHASITSPQNHPIKIMQIYSPHNVIFTIKDYQTHQLPQEIEDKINGLSESVTELSLPDLASQGMPSGKENTLTKIFAAVKASGKIQFVQTLDIGVNNLYFLPETIGDFFNLQTLDIRGNNLSFLPEGLSKLSHLTSLNVSQNNLSILPENLTELSSLKHLDASANTLETLFEGLGHLKSLEYLNLSQNKLTALPKTLRELKNLKSLDAENNGLTALPEGFDPLTQVQHLYLDNNPLNDKTRAIHQEVHKEAIKKLRLEGG